jgi:WD40 repeat protein
MRFLVILFLVLMPSILASQGAKTSVAQHAVALETHSLPGAEGEIVGANFSPDGRRLAVVRHMRTGEVPVHTVQILTLPDVREIARKSFIDGDPADLSTGPHLLRYSPDGRQLVLAAVGSELLLFLNAATLEESGRVWIHDDGEGHDILPRNGVRAHRYFHGVVDVATASQSGVFGVLTSAGDGEVSLYSFASMRMVQRWTTGPDSLSYWASHTSLSLSADGGLTAVSVVPDLNGKVPKGSKNLLVYDSRSGSLKEAIRTPNLIGPLEMVPDDHILAARIDIPGLFTKKACIEEWNLEKATLESQLCDPDASVRWALGVSANLTRIAGFAASNRKDIEGHAYDVSGYLDVWDRRSGELIGRSARIQGIISKIEFSPDGAWIFAGQTLYRVGEAH